MNENIFCHKIIRSVTYFTNFEKKCYGLIKDQKNFEESLFRMQKYEGKIFRIDFIWLSFRLLWFSRMIFTDDWLRKNVLAVFLYPFFLGFWESMSFEALPFIINLYKPGEDFFDESESLSCTGIRR